MTQVLEGRWTAKIEGDFVVFIIGAQIRNPLRAWRALPLLGQMRAMLSELDAARAGGEDRGFLGYENYGIGPFGVIVQYWRTHDDLESFARTSGGRHAAVWRNWNRAAQNKNRAVGIWHESYAVAAGRYDAIYQNMPALGLAKAGQPERVARRTGTARDRLGETDRAETAPVPVVQYDG